MYPSIGFPVLFLGENCSSRRSDYEPGRIYRLALPPPLWGCFPLPGLAGFHCDSAGLVSSFGYKDLWMDFAVCFYCSVADTLALHQLLSP